MLFFIEIQSACDNIYILLYFFIEAMAAPDAKIPEVAMAKEQDSANTNVWIIESQKRMPGGQSGKANVWKRIASTQMILILIRVSTFKWHSFFKF